MIICMSTERRGYVRGIDHKALTSNEASGGSDGEQASEHVLHGVGRGKGLS
jgi:hypothetical protein